jgi:transcription elongation factor SPT5
LGEAFYLTAEHFSPFFCLPVDQMSSSAALLDQDFGSESEDDNFNPAPADDSDNDAAGESVAQVGAKKSTHSTTEKRRTAGEGRAADGVENQMNGSSLEDGNLDQPEDEDEEGDNCKHTCNLPYQDGS